MNLGRYINTLLLEHDIMIIPDFGAFISSYMPAQINDESGEIAPPSKKISFDPKIRNNDGLLISQIVEKEQISHQEALRKIEKEKDNIQYRLDKGEKVTIENIGTLFYNENHEIQFASSLKDNLLLDAFGLETISLKDLTEDSPEKKSDNTRVTETEEIKETGSSKEQKSKPAVHEPEHDKEPVPKPEPPFKEPERPPEKKKNKGWLWVLLVLVILIAGAIFILKKDKKKVPDTIDIIVEQPPHEEQITDEQSITFIDTTETDSLELALTDTIKTTEEKIDSTITPDPSKFYLISGSFKEQENAVKYFQQMKNKGYEPFHLGKQGNFYIVGISIYDNEIEAYGAQYDFLDKYPDSGVWVFIPE